jgi:hypothetical protein
METTAVKRDLATRLCKLYAEIMQAQSRRPKVGIAELGEVMHRTSFENVGVAGSQHVIIAGRARSILLHAIPTTVC